MGEYNFTYEIPNDFNNILIRTLRINGFNEMPNILEKCKISFENLGYAYYAGIRKGDTWDKYALNVTIEAPVQAIDELKRYTKTITEWIQKVLKPNESGFLIKKVEFLVLDDDMIVDLPKSTEDNLVTLNNEIYKALSNKRPALVLDRLHTFSIKYIREICQKHNIQVKSNKGDFLPLHSLAGSLAKYYDENNMFQSDFTITALKASISIFDKYNIVRNNQSYAHDNEILDDVEAEYAIRIMAATLNLIDNVENGKIS